MVLANHSSREMMLARTTKIILEIIIYHYPAPGHLRHVMASKIMHITDLISVCRSPNNNVYPTGSICTQDNRIE